MKPIQIGLLGLGTVGLATYQVLKRNQDEIIRRTGRGLIISMVADLDTARASQLVDADCKVVSDGKEIIENPDIDLVIELIGGYGVAFDLVMAAVNAGKHVVTANKAMLAAKGPVIFEAAQKSGVMIGYEAAVAGGIPIIKSLREGLSANQIQWVVGIINGTTNFILTEMREKGLSFGAALQEAQALGYAEADPTFDIQGIDAAHKISIMSSISFGVDLSFDKAYVEGITELQSQDIEFANQLGYRIKLLGISKKTDDGIELRVHPSLVSSKSLIANVEGAMNAVMVNADAVGTTLYYGKGAGGEPTASAVIADLMDIARLFSASPDQRIPHLAFQTNAMKNAQILNIEDVVTCYYLRLSVADQAGVLASVTSILADFGISIDAMLQQPAVIGQDHTELVILTHTAKESVMNQALQKIQKLPTVLVPVVRIRKEDLV
jgi:homoserine dehydrogenase